MIPTQKRRHFRSDEICWCTSNSIHTGAPATERPCATNRAAEAVRGLGNPTALAEIDRGLPDALKVVLDLRIGV